MMTDVLRAEAAAQSRDVGGRRKNGAKGNRTHRRNRGLLPLLALRNLVDTEDDGSQRRWTIFADSCRSLAAVIAGR